MGKLEGCNLEEVGLTSRQAAEFGKLTTTAARVCYLRRYRKDVLEELHEKQRDLDRVDYLIFTLQHEGKER